MPEPLLSSDIDWDGKSGKAILQLKNTIMRKEEAESRDSRSGILGAKKGAQDFQALEQALADEAAEGKRGTGSLFLTSKTVLTAMTIVSSAGNTIFKKKKSLVKRKTGKRRSEKRRHGKKESNSMLEGDLVRCNCFRRTWGS